MPRWIAESEVASQEAERLELGAEPRDLSAYAVWRADASESNLDLLAFYETYLVGQVDGISGALNLSDVREAMEIDGVSLEDQPETMRRLRHLHSLVMEHAKARAPRRRETKWPRL